jgi:excisionase family DNA binding protein
MTRPAPIPAARRLLRLRAAAEYLGLSAWKIRDEVNRGEIPIVSYGDNAPWLIDLADLDGWILRHKVTR